MAIEKNNFKVSRFDSEYSPGSRDSMSSDEDELQRRNSVVESDDDDEFDDADSGAGSDDFDLLELGETGAEFCQIGTVTCSVPFELYDLSGLEDILSVEVWNESLGEEERFSLTKYLPDMDQHMYMRTLKELFTGANFHFGSPIKKLFDMLKGGLCEPRVALYREGLNFFQKREHYHFLRKHQNDIVSNFCQTRDAWLNCKGYSIEERLRVLNIMKSQKSLMSEKMEALDSDSSGREESGDAFWSRRVKDRKTAQKTDHLSAYGPSSKLELPSRGQSRPLEMAKYGKENPKGTLKMAGSKMPSTKECVDHFPAIYHGLDVDAGPYSSAVSLSRKKKEAGSDLRAGLRVRDQMRTDNDAEDPIFGMGVQRDKSGVLRVGKKHESFRGEEFSSGLKKLSLSSKSDLNAYSKNRSGNQLAELKMYGTNPSTLRSSQDFPQKTKYSVNAQQFDAESQIMSLKGRVPLKRNRVDLSDHAEPFWNDKNQVEAFPVRSSFKTEDWSIRIKQWKIGRKSPDLNFKSSKVLSTLMNDRILHPEFRSKPSVEKMRGQGYYAQNGGADLAARKGNGMLMKSEETESDSSEQFDDDDEGEEKEEDDDNNLLIKSKLAYPNGVMEGSRMSLVKSGVNVKKTKYIKKDVQEIAGGLDGFPHSSRKGRFGEHEYMLGIENYSSKEKQKGKMHKSSPLHSSVVRDSSLSALDAFDGDDDGIDNYRLGRNGKSRGDLGERLQTSSLKTVKAEKKPKKDTRNQPMPYSNYLHDYVVEEDVLPLASQLAADDKVQGRTVKKGQAVEAYANDHHDKPEASLVGCSSVSKKRKGKGDVVDMDVRHLEGSFQSIHQQQMDDSTSLRKKGKRKMEADAGMLNMGISEPPVTEIRAIDVETETKPQKKPFTLITPTIHTGFSFSIIHLLSAVRMAMITPLPEDTLEVNKPREEQNRKHGGDVNGDFSCENVNTNNADHAGRVNVPALAVPEIVNRVRSNPGDPCILETQEPLQDLVRGVLKIFSSKTAPLGAKGWKALVVYEKSTKSWSWIGPISYSSADNETIEEVTSPEAWGLPHKMLVKLVDSFANWLKSGQETLQQIGSLPAPPVSLMQFNLDEKERFRDLRAQKSLHTIGPSSEDVRAYFRKEEVLRYSIPDRAFSYTAVDGKKSIVAPLRRCGGKPTSKARDHFMLKRDRPPHVTILCLVRDAAARLPGSIGTRADVCTLIRDSQYIVEDVSDSQVNQVVSGALDRLHYERDPCVQFDAERKLWVYLHREREEEDFEDDGTSSTKKWKRQKKDAAEPSDQGAVTVAYHGTGDQSGLDLCSDLNVEPSCADDDKRTEVLYDRRENVEDNVDTSHGSDQNDIHRGHSMVWDALGLNSVRENKLLCQENSTNEDFDDETFGRERPVGLLSASLL